MIIVKQSKHYLSCPTYLLFFLPLAQALAFLHKHTHAHTVTHTDFVGKWAQRERAPDLRKQNKKKIIIIY